MIKIQYWNEFLEVIERRHICFVRRILVIQEVTRSRSENKTYKVKVVLHWGKETESSGWVKEFYIKNNYMGTPKWTWIKKMDFLEEVKKRVRNVRWLKRFRLNPLFTRNPCDQGSQVVRHWRVRRFSNQ